MQSKKVENMKYYIRDSILISDISTAFILQFIWVRRCLGIVTQLNKKPTELHIDRLYYVNKSTGVRCGVQSVALMSTYSYSENPTFKTDKWSI